MNCPICLEIKGEPHQDHGHYGALVEQASHVVARTADFTCIPSLGPLNAHHVLIAPNTHLLSMASIRSNELAEQLAWIKSSITRFNQETFDLDTVFFEHGTGSMSKIACACIEHAHLHAIATNQDIRPVLVAHYDFADAALLEQALRLAETGYYFYEHSRSGPVISLRRLEPQFFRIILWRSFGDWAPWNWRLHHNLPLMKEILANYSNFGRELHPRPTVLISNRSRVRR